MASEYTSVYVSLKKEDDEYIDNLRTKRIEKEKKHLTKTDIVKDLIHKGMGVINGDYLRLDPSIDEFVSQLQTMVIETSDGKKVEIKKSKEQVYNMIIEKGLQHLND